MDVIGRHFETSSKHSALFCDLYFQWILPYYIELCFIHVAFPWFIGVHKYRGYFFPSSQEKCETFFCRQAKVMRTEGKKFTKNLITNTLRDVPRSDSHMEKTDGK